MSTCLRVALTFLRGLGVLVLVLVGYAAVISAMVFVIPLPPPDWLVYSFAALALLCLLFVIYIVGSFT